MPLIDEDVLLSNTTASTLARYVPEDEARKMAESKPTFGETTAAFFKLENPIFNVTKEWLAPQVSGEVDPDFDPISRLEKERPDLFDEYAMDFSEAVNEEEYNRKMLNVDFELEQKDILRRSSTLSVLASGLIDGIVDPFTLIPAVKVVKNGMLAGRVLKSAGTGAALGAGTAGLSEGILQATQETRTIEESRNAMIIQTLMGSLLGAGAGVLSNNPAASEFAVALEHALDGSDVNFKITKDGKAMDVDSSTYGSGSVGAAEINKAALYKTGLIRINKKATSLTAGPDFLKAPDLRAAESESFTLNQLGAVFYNSNYQREGHLYGMSTGANAQNAIYRRDNLAFNTINEVDKLYLQHTGTGALRSGIRQLRPEGKLSSRDFSRRIFTALTSRDYVDAIPEVNKAAKLIRKDMDGVVKELQGMNLISKDLDPEFIKTYMTRVYDLDKLTIPANRLKFISKVGNWVKNHNKDGTIRKAPIDNDVAEEIAEGILKKIKGETDQQIALQGLLEGFISKGKFLKERQLLIPDSEIQEFLVDDAVMLYQNYMRKTTRLIETQKALNKYGSILGKQEGENTTIVDVLGAIQKESQKAISEISDPKQQLKKSKYYEKQEQLASDMYRSLLGQITKPGEGSRVVKELLAYQYITRLGGVLISSISEPAMFVYRAGLARTFRDFIIPTIRSLKTAKLTKDKMADLSGSYEIANSRILRALGGIDELDQLGRNRSIYEQGRDVALDFFTKATGIAHWTTGERRIASQMASADIIRTIIKGPKGKDIQRLATLGIDKSKYKMLKETFETKGYVDYYKGSYIPNRELWDNLEAKEIFDNAVQNEIESMVLKPGIEALPFLVQKHGVGRILFQYKTFMNAASHRITISGLQRRDAQVLQGLIGLTIGGMISDQLYRMIKGDDTEKPLDELILAGISRSGWMGLIGTATLDIGSQLANKNRRRYADRSLEGQLLGPSVGTVRDIGALMSRLSDGDVNKKDIKAALKFIPFNNLFYIRMLTDRALSD